jgi:hypothetical protein
MTGRSQDELRASYLATEVFVELDGELLDAPEAARRLGTPLFVLTAHNPASVILDDAVNDARNAVLLDQIEAAGLTVYPAIGKSPDGSWFEPGFALSGADLATAIDLGREHGQNAIFEVLPDRLVVHACDGSYRLERPAGSGQPS